MHCPRCGQQVHSSLSGLTPNEVASSNLCNLYTRLRTAMPCYCFNSSINVQTLHALYVLKGEVFLRLSVGGPSDQTEKIKRARALAFYALKRLDTSGPRTRSR